MIHDRCLTGCWIRHFSIKKFNTLAVLKLNDADVVLTLPIPIPDEENKLNFYFHTYLWCLRRFYEGLKGYFYFSTTFRNARDVVLRFDSLSWKQKTASYIFLQTPWMVASSKINKVLKILLNLTFLEFPN